MHPFLLGSHSPPAIVRTTLSHVLLAYFSWWLVWGQGSLLCVVAYPLACVDVTVVALARLCFSITCVNATVVALASVCLSIIYVYATSVALGVLVCLAVRVFLKRHVHR